MFLSLYDLFKVFLGESQKSQFLAIFGHCWSFLASERPYKTLRYSKSDSFFVFTRVFGPKVSFFNLFGLFRVFWGSSRKIRFLAIF